MKVLSFLKDRRLAGFSVAESVIALGIGAVAVTGGMTLNSHQLRLVKSVRETNAASHALEERIEQLRLVNWKQMTDPTYVTAHYFSQTPKSAHVLPEYFERLTVTAFPDVAACTPLAIERSKTGATTVLSSGQGLNDQRLARVNLRVTWKGKDSKLRVRELASIISNAGINATSLPAMGSDSGASTSGTTTTSTDSGGGTSTTGTDSSASTGTSTTTTSTTTTSEEDDKGNGRGNVAGKSGKK